jgi:GNAT superfamily N-acetyltransferase
VARLIDSLLAELNETPSKLEERCKTTLRLLAIEDRVFSFLAYEKVEPVGVIMVTESLSIYAGGVFGVITELYVVPSSRSAGVAQSLIEVSATLARERGWRQLEVGAPTQPQWARSLKFYLRNGFTEIGPCLILLV